MLPCSKLEFAVPVYIALSTPTLQPSPNVQSCPTSFTDTLSIEPIKPIPDLNNIFGKESPELAYAV